MEIKQPASQAIKEIKGKIVDETGEPLIGVNVSVEGGTTGTISDFDGNFSVKAPENSVLKISYIGYMTQQIPVSGKSFYQIVMKQDTEELEEVVVTALGIKRAEKALSYNVQQINTDAITSNKDVNFVNSLSGKVAGVNINASSSGVGGISKVVMRGTKSIMQSSNAAVCH